MNVGGTRLAWHEVADSHPAARTTTMHVCRAADPCSAAAAALAAKLELEALHERSHDRFVSAGGWSGWRVSAPAELAGKWIYTRDAPEEANIWPPHTWPDCLARYDSRADPAAPIPAGAAAWEQRMRHDLAAAAALTQAMGTGGPLDPFPEVDRRIGGEVIKPVLSDIRATYETEGPGTRLEPRSLAAVSTKIGVLRASEHLVEPHFIDRAEAWLRSLAAAGAALEETDRMELRLLAVLDQPDFTTLMGCCALAAMCELDPESAESWYRTGGDCSGHPDIRQYTALTGERLPEPPPAPSTPAAAAGEHPSPPREEEDDSGRARLTHCGAPTLTGSLCRHKVSPSATACPAGHPQGQNAV